MGSSFYGNPTRRFIADGAIGKLPEILAARSARRALLVTGQKSFRLSPHYARLKSLLADIKLVESTPVHENPTVDFVKEFSRKHKKDACDVVLAAGGGSVLDVAKLAAVLLTQAESALDEYITGDVSCGDRRIGLIAMPTTAGTGSEVTPYASLTTRERKKITVTHASLYPDFALVDSLLTHSMPAHVTASTGFDALSQGIEAFWSVNHSPFSDAHALRAVNLAYRFLVRAVRRPGDAEARYGMSLASCESGLAIAHTATTAVHSVSYPITTHFHVPHGHACALTLPQFIRYNEDVMKEERYALLWQAMGVPSAREAASTVERMMGEAGLSRSLASLGVPGDGIETIVQNGFRPDRVKNNPKPLTPEALRAMLHEIA